MRGEIPFSLTIETFLRTKEGEQVKAIYRNQSHLVRDAAKIVYSVFKGTVREADVYRYWYWQTYGEIYNAEAETL